MGKSKYITWLSILVLGQMVNVAFKMNGFKAPWMSDNPLDIEGMASADAAVMDLIAKTKKQADKKLLEQDLQLPEFLAPYIESKQYSTPFFDILNDEEFANIAVGESKLELTQQLAEKDQQLNDKNARILALEAELAELKATDSDSSKPEVETEEPQSD